MSGRELYSSHRMRIFSIRSELLLSFQLLFSTMRNTDVCMRIKIVRSGVITLDSVSCYVFCSFSLISKNW